MAIGRGCDAGTTAVIYLVGMKHNVPVSKIMSSDPITVHHGDPISKIRKTFADSGVNHLPVTSGDKLVGLVSWTDMMRVSFGDSFGQSAAAEDAVLDHTHKLEDIMNSEPVTIGSDRAIREAAEVLSEANFHALPVVDDGKLVGILSTQDLIKYLRDLY